MSLSHTMARVARTAAACTLCAALAGCASLSQVGLRDELAGAERAFARDGIAVGIQAAFMAHFAPDGLVFQPGPVRVREVWPTRPAPADPLALRLEWQPALVHVARAGDLGLSTGPFHLVDTKGNRADSYGAFFSVWQRQADGTWKVWLDMGARTNAPVPETAWASPPRPRPGPQQQASPTASTIAELDAGLSRIPGSEFALSLALSARRYAEGGPPLVGAEWESMLAGSGDVTEYTPSEARVSASGDLAASYGRTVRQARGGAVTTGYYVHVWMRDGGAWWLAVESMVEEG